MIAAYFSDLMGDCGQEAERIRQIGACIQEEAGEEPRLLAVMSGDFFQNGCVAPLEKQQRIQKGFSAGAEAVLEMSCFASLSSVGIFAFSGARLLDKLGGVELLALETRDASLKQLTEISYLLIVNDRQFQERVAFYKGQGENFYQAQARAIGERIPGGEQVMSCWENIFAVECIKSLKLMYSGIRCVCVPLQERPGLFAEWEMGHKMEDGLDSLLRYQLYYSETELSDIYGGYEHLSNRILELRDGYGGFFPFTEQLAEGQAVYDIRKYFLRLLCGINKSTIGIWRMYDFAPFLSLHVEEEKTAQLLAEGSRIQLLAAGREAEGIPEPGKEWTWLAEGRALVRLERSKEELLRLERRTGQICGLLRG